MLDTLRQKYKVDKDNIQKSYEYHLALKNNKDYEKRVDDAFLGIVNYFKEEYPNVVIETPRGREKSNRSLKGKLEKLEIERLCKLFAIGKISEEEYNNLYLLIKEKVDERSQDMLSKICFEKITDLDRIDQIMSKEDIIEDIKTAILRISNTKFKNANNVVLEKELDNKYGRGAVARTKQLKDDILRWESIEKIENDEEEIKKLSNPMEYLRAKDLRGFKIILCKADGNNKDIKMSDDQKCLEISKEFAKKIMNNQELLDSLNIAVQEKGGYKHKTKQNGYRAEHIKLYCKGHPNYTFEIQLRTTYREELSRANGPAAHNKRSGKERIFPNVSNKRVFLDELKQRVPKYTILKKENGKLVTYKCNLMENMLEYYMGYIKLNSNEYIKAMEYVREEMEIEK